jgi:hypothetical protein
MEQRSVNDVCGGLQVSSFGTQVMAIMLVLFVDPGHCWRGTAHGYISVCVDKPDLELQYFSRKSLLRHQTNNI